MPTFGNHVCVNCKRMLKIKKNGIIVAEHLKNGELYKVWSADLFECPNCGFELISGFGNQPNYHHFDKKAEEEIAKAKKLSTYYEFT